MSGFHYAACLAARVELRAELDIDCRDVAKKEQPFDQLHADQLAIERAAGGRLRGAGHANDRWPRLGSAAEPLDVGEIFGTTCSPLVAQQVLAADVMNGPVAQPRGLA